MGDFLTTSPASYWSVLSSVCCDWLDVVVVVGVMFGVGSDVLSSRFWCWVLLLLLLLLVQHFLDVM